MLQARSLFVQIRGFDESLLNQLQILKRNIDCAFLSIIRCITVPVPRLITLASATTYTSKTKAKLQIKNIVSQQQ